MNPKIVVDQTETYFIQQFFTCCLAEMAYYIESDKVAAIIDPMRDYQIYLDLAKSRGATIKYIFETHFHADFVSGHLDIAKHTGATIVFGPTAAPKYEIQVAKDEEVFNLGQIKIKVLHTPGHTPESSSYVLIDEKDQPKCVFTGDTLFLGEVGRPDLACNSTISKEDLAGLLFDSLRSKIFPLPRNITVYPAHGAGSSCGKNISDGTFDLLENQFKTNWALQDVSREDFIAKLTNISAPPQYYFYDAKVNREGYESLEDFLEHSNKSLTPQEVKKQMEEGALLIDGRLTEEYMTESVPGSLFLSLAMPFAQWIGTLIKPDTKIVILAPLGQEKESVVRLARIGYNNLLGYVEGGIEGWKAANLEVRGGKSVNSQEFIDLFQQGVFTLDVRKPDELLVQGSLKDVQNIELTALEKELIKNPDLFPRDKEIYLLCRTGQRSVVAMTFLRKFGYENLINIRGGFLALKETSYEGLVLPK